MRFMGSKNRISKYIVPFIQNCINKNEITTYFEPFVGGANIIDKVKCERRIGNDSHTELIALFKALQDGYEPPMTITEEEYQDVRQNRDDYPPHYVGLVGFCATFGAKYFGGFGRGRKADGITERDVPNEGIRNLLKQQPNIMDVEFTNANYLDIDMQDAKGWMIYCDPPYEGTTKYNKQSINYKEYWDWVRNISKDNYVLVSEYNAPEDFYCIWDKEVVLPLQVSIRDTRVERLFTYNEGLYKKTMVTE